MMIMIGPNNDDDDATGGDERAFYIQQMWYTAGAATVSLPREVRLLWQWRH